MITYTWKIGKLPSECALIFRDKDVELFNSMQIFPLYHSLYSQRYTGIGLFIAYDALKVSCFNCVFCNIPYAKRLLATVV